MFIIPALNALEAEQSPLTNLSLLPDDTNISMRDLKDWFNCKENLHVDKSK